MAYSDSSPRIEGKEESGEAAPAKVRRRQVVSLGAARLHANSAESARQIAMTGGGGSFPEVRNEASSCKKAIARQGHVDQAAYVGVGRKKLIRGQASEDGKDL